MNTLVVALLLFAKLSLQDVYTESTNRLSVDTNKTDTSSTTIPLLRLELHLKKGRPIEQKRDHRPYALTKSFF